MNYYHELTHAKQFAKMQNYFLGNNALETKYQLMIFHDVFTDSLEKPPQSFIGKVSSKISKEINDKNYFLNPLEVDARMESAKFLLGLENVVKSDSELLKSFKKNAISSIKSDAEIISKTGTQMLQVLDKKKELFEKRYGNCELGKALLKEYELVRNSKATRVYEQKINGFGIELSEAKKELKF